MEYRKLNTQEIEALQSRGCRADNWDNVEVADGFTPEFISNAVFSGAVRLGRFEKSFTLPGGVMIHSGISDARLHNVSIADNCCVHGVRGYIANYDISEDCLIDNVGDIYTEGESCFGNGVKVSVLNETGGREVVIHDGLSSHEAYMIALYRHRPDFIEKMNAIIDGYVRTCRSSRGHIGRGVRITGVSSIRNVRIGDACVLEGVLRLSEGSLNGSAEAPVVLGQGVICEDFIISEGSTVTDGVMLTRCFVGQACRFGHGYSASDSLFFCNCQGENGEACAIFAGPYTVTHHKSTLLIAGMFSFMNAGSGSNQSNHMYKLGPIHQEKGETSYLAPGVNLRSVGTIRDARKWPRRDERRGTDKHDLINYNLLSPFTIQKMIKGLQTLEHLRYASGELSDVYSFHSVKITNHSLKRGMELYRIAIDKFMGNSLISRLQESDGSFAELSEAQLHSKLRPDTPVGSGEWVDISGLIAPKSEIAALMNGIERGSITSLREIRDAFKQMADNYYSYEWTWAFQHIQQLYGINPSKMTREEAVSLIERWKDAVVKLDNMIFEDARKEFNLASKTGFGADGDKSQKESDFEQVRGDFESNPFVRSVLDHISAKTELGRKAVAALNNQ